MTSRTALVTGTAQGIGQAIAGELAASGLRVVGVDIKPHSDAALTDVIVADLSRIEECLRVVSEAGKVDVLVNTAAVLVQEPLETFDMGDYEHVMGVNLRAPFLLGRELGPRMADRGWGRIVNISCLGARRAGEPFRHRCPPTPGRTRPRTRPCLVRRAALPISALWPQETA